MGEVYKARDTRLDRTVAIKVLLAHVADDPDLRQRFEREAKTISSLNHPHICTLHDIGQQDGIDYLVMEHLEDETLAARLTKGLKISGMAGSSWLGGLRESSATRTDKRSRQVCRLKSSSPHTLNSPTLRRPQNQ